MRGDGWRRDSPVPRATPVPQTSPVKGYPTHDARRVPVAIESDSEEFGPSDAAPDGSVSIFANIPSGSIRMTEGASVVVDCGFSIEIPMGYRCRVSSSVPGVMLDMVDSKRFKVNAINLGGETILHDRESIGRVWIEPVHFFEWITRG